ncbi:MAG: hypothetical protein ACLR8J_03005 [Sutterella wadsworthensis]
MVKGKITGDVVNLQGSFINLYATAEIIGRDVTLTQIDQVSQDTDKKFDGGRITATEKLTLTSFFLLREYAHLCTRHQGGDQCTYSHG